MARDVYDSQKVILVDPTTGLPVSADIGAAGDTAWTGTGSGSLTALLKAIWNGWFSATGLATQVNFASAANTTPILIKAGAGRLKVAAAFNYNAAARYIKFYDKATSPTVGTDLPAYTLGLGPGAFTGTPPATAIDGIKFTNGLYIAVTTSQLESDNTAGSARDLVGFAVVY